MSRLDLHLLNTEWLQGVSDEKKLEELQNALSRIGITLKREIRKAYEINPRCSRDMADREIETITMYWNDETLDRKVTRGAGGKNKKRLSQKILLTEIEQRVKESSSDKVAEDLGIGRATLYRKMKKAKENNIDYIE